MRLLSLIILLAASAANGDEPPRVDGVVTCLVENRRAGDDALFECIEPVALYCGRVAIVGAPAGQDEVATACYGPYISTIDAAAKRGFEMFLDQRRRAAGLDEADVTERTVRMELRHRQEFNDLKCRQLAEKYSLRSVTSYGAAPMCRFETSAHMFSRTATLIGDDAAKWLAP